MVIGANNHNVLLGVKVKQLTSQRHETFTTTLRVPPVVDIHLFCCSHLETFIYLLLCSAGFDSILDQAKLI